MGKKSKKHHNEVFKFTLPEAPDICDDEMVNYIANVNTMFEFFPERHGKIIKCLTTNWELIDEPHKDKIRLLYRYAFCYFSKMKQTSTELMTEELKEYMISEIKKLSDELCHYSKILMIYEMTKPMGMEKKVIWYKDIINKLIYDNTLDKDHDHNHPINRLMFNFGYALSNPNANTTFCTHVNEFISKLMSSTETSDDIKFMNIISNEVPRREDNRIGDLISVSYRDKEIDKLYSDILSKDYSNFPYVLRLIDKLKYVPSKTYFDKIVREIKSHKDMHWRNTQLFIEAVTFKFRQ